MPVAIRSYSFGAIAGEGRPDLFSRRFLPVPLIIAAETAAPNALSTVRRTDATGMLRLASLRHLAGDV